VRAGAAAEYLVPLLFAKSVPASSLSQLARLTLEASVLARLAEDAQVDRLTARRALRLRTGETPTTDGQRRFIERLSRLSRAEVEELRTSVAGGREEAFALVRRDEEEPCDDA
jgi:hypothetical protein